MRSYKKTQTRKNLLVKSSVGGKSTKKRSVKKNYQKGGDGQGNGGHDVGFPIQYFGGKLNRYFPAGSPELVPKNGAYGETVATSFGKNVPSLYAKNMVGPNLAPFPNSSGIQTGGKKKKNKTSGGGSGSSASSLALEASLASKERPSVMDTGPGSKKDKIIKTGKY